MSAESVLTIKITIAGIDPPVWRRLQVSSTTSLKSLARILRIGVGWMVPRSFQFHAQTADGVVVVCEDTQVAVGTLLIYPGDKLGYLYDVTRHQWPHMVELESVVPGTLETPVCIEGARACPPDDCPGPWQYHSMIRKRHNPELFLVNLVNKELSVRGRPSLRRLDAQNAG